MAKSSIDKAIDDALDDHETMVRLSRNHDFIWFLGKIKELGNDQERELDDSGKRPSHYSHVELVELLSIKHFIKKILSIPIAIRMKAKSRARRQ